MAGYSGSGVCQDWLSNATSIMIGEHVAEWMVQER